MMSGKQSNSSIFPGSNSAVLWLEGLSGAGKTTIGTNLSSQLRKAGHPVIFLDGDNVRRGLSSDLGFSHHDRAENIRRTAEVAKLIAADDALVVVAMITPLQTDRQVIRQILSETTFVEVFVDAPVAVCEKRDPKGLYRKARRGDIPQFTGIDSRFETPESPEVHIDTVRLSEQQSVAKIIDFIANLNSNDYSRPLKSVDVAN